jgi:tetratricopeptide (TPR) repeat protein
VHCELLLLRETINRRIGNRVAQQDDIDRLDRYADSDSALRAEVLYRKILLARSLGSREQEFACIGELELVVRTFDSAQWSARLFACRADHYALVNRFEEAASEGRAALAIHIELGDVDAEVADLCLLASIAMQRGAISAAREHLTSAQTLAKERGNPQLVADTLFAASSSAMILHDLATCMDLARDAGDLYVSLGDREGEADALARIATALARLGRHDEARKHNVAAAAIFESIGKRQGLAIAKLNIGLISCRLGVLGTAIEHFEGSAELFREIQDVRGQAVCAINVSCLRLRMGNAAQAKADAKRALRLSRKMNHAVYEAEALANLGAAERDLGELDAAIEHMRLGLSRQLETGRISDRVNDLADLALAYFLNGELPAAVAAIGEVISAAQGTAADVSLWPQNLYWIAARIYRAAGRDAEWPALLTSARTIMNERAEALADQGERGAFFELPLNREIEDAYNGKDWPKATG